jgi:hypothetical protein
MVGLIVRITTIGLSILFCFSLTFNWLSSFQNHLTLGAGATLNQKNPKNTSLKVTAISE